MPKNANRQTKIMPTINLPLLVLSTIIAELTTRLVPLRKGKKKKKKPTRLVTLTIANMDTR